MDYTSITVCKERSHNSLSATTDPTRISGAGVCDRLYRLPFMTVGPGISVRRARRQYLFPAFLSSGLLMATLVTSSPVFAQGAPQITPPVFDPTLRSGEPPAPLKKEFTPPSMPPPSPVLPPVPPTSPEDGAQQQLGQIQVFVKTIHVTGNTVFSIEEINAVTKPYENRSLPLKIWNSYGSHSHSCTSTRAISRPVPSSLIKT